MKSKTSATTMMKTTAVSTGGAGRRARHLEDGSLGHVRPVPPAGGGGLEVVEDVVEASREVVDVFAVDRRDEGRVQSPDDLVGDLVARVLDLLDRVRLGPRVGKGVDQLVEETGRPDDVLRLLLEVVEEPDFLRDQIEHGASPQCITPCAARAREARGARDARRPRAPGRAP